MSSIDAFGSPMLQGLRGGVSGRHHRALASAALLAISTGCLGATLDKSFGPATISAGGVSILTFTVTNPAGAGALSNVGFVDTLPTGLQVANPPGVGGTCANAAAATTTSAGGTTITVANLNVPAGAATCTVTVNVTHAAGQFNPTCAGNPPAFTNAAGNVTVSNVTNGVQPSCLVIIPPTLGKSFSPATIGVGGVTVLTFTVTNPAGAGALSNVGFVDTLPAGLQVANPPGVGGTCANAAAATTTAAGGSTITVTNLNVPAGGATCTLTVNVTHAAGQFNPSCAGNPPAFTNAAGNVAVSNVANGVQPSCVVVASAAPTSAAVPATGGLVVAILIGLIGVIAGVDLRSRRPPSR